ncbi:MAG: hypothetical protein A2020_00115 [Lentisphaerae bacterium GWF2_45_14]|nr:MAG: hypothetical protein A2020_00115 [Lentisphaerae bacterium GWF2_45_14]
MKKKSINSATKHRQLLDILRSEIERKAFKNNKFHTVRKLMDAYSVSQATVTRALEALLNEGLIYSVPGKGLFVSAVKKDQELRAGLKVLNYIVRDNDIFSPCSSPANWFVSKDILEGVLGEAYSRGYFVNIIPSGGNLDNRTYIESIIDCPRESVFIFSCYNIYEDMIQRCINKNVPYSVYCWHEKQNRKINQLWVDIEHAAYTITKYLIRLGHKEIGFVGGALASHRYKGFRKAMREAALKCPASRVLIFEEGSIEGTAAAAEDFLRSNPGITALSCSSDMRAIGVMKAASALRINVPGDLSIAGIDDISELYPVSPELTTMRFPRKELGRALVNLVDGIKKSGLVETSLLYTSLAEKDSCRKIRKGFN